MAWSRFHLCTLQFLLLPQAHIIERRWHSQVRLTHQVLNSLDWWLQSFQPAGYTHHRCEFPGLGGSPRQPVFSGQMVSLTISKKHQLAQGGQAGHLSLSTETLRRRGTALRSTLGLGFDTSVTCHPDAVRFLKGVSPVNPPAKLIGVCIVVYALTLHMPAHVWTMWLFFLVHGKSI